MVTTSSTRLKPLSLAVEKAAEKLRRPVRPEASSAWAHGTAAKPVHLVLSPGNAVNSVRQLNSAASVSNGNYRQGARCDRIGIGYVTTVIAWIAGSATVIVTNKTHTRSG